MALSLVGNDLPLPEGISHVVLKHDVLQCVHDNRGAAGKEQADENVATLTILGERKGGEYSREVAILRNSCWGKDKKTT